VSDLPAQRTPADACPRFTTLLLAIAATAVGVAIQIHDGEYTWTIGGGVSIGLITLAIGAAGIAIAGRGGRTFLRLAAPLARRGPLVGANTRAPRPASGAAKQVYVGSAPRTDSDRLEESVRSADPTTPTAASNDFHAEAKRRQEPEAGEKLQRRAAPGSPGDLTLIGLYSLLAIQFAFLLFSRPDSRDHPYLQPVGLHSLIVYRARIVVAAIVAAVSVVASLPYHAYRVSAANTGKRVRLRLAPQSALKLLFATELAAFVALGGWCISTTSVPGSDVHPHIDVFVFQQQAARALLHGRNPYAIDDFPDIYTDAATGKPRQEVYGPGMSDGLHLHFGFPYLPASLYLATLGYAATGDYRNAQLAALVVSAVLIYLTKRTHSVSSAATSTPGRSGRGLDPQVYFDPSNTSELASRPIPTSALAAALLLFTPRIFFILISGWTEPFLVLWMSAAVYCACRRPRLLPIALGLLLATKQYMALAVLPATVLLVPRDAGAAGWRALLPRWRDWLKLLAATAAVAFLVSAPLALWDLRKFYFSVVTVQRYAPFRWDALSYLTWHAFGHGEPSPGLTVSLPGLMAAAAIALCLWRAPRTPAGFAASVGFIMLVFFAFSKQAFANYYFFVIGAMCCAVAASGKATHE
jgi:hypothetical protein